MSARQHPHRPKPPSSRAGEEIVQAVLAAAETVIDEDGLDRFTTSRVVERAGVSVGSLYQYFPSKESILAELARRLERRTQHRIIEILESSTSDSLEHTAGQIIDVLLVGIGGLEFRRALRRAVPQGWIEDTASEVDLAVRAQLAGELSRRSDVRSGEHALMAWVIGHAIEGAIEAAVLVDPELARSTPFRAELVELVTRYLRK
jgi:AcrR family transcriptional regulator